MPNSQEINQRKIVQITTAVVPGMDNMSNPVFSIYALCDDGTLWMGDGNGWWNQVPGPEHLSPLAYPWHIRDKLKKELNSESYEIVKKAFTGIIGL